jgi:hypothetical protein
MPSCFLPLKNQPIFKQARLLSTVELLEHLWELPYTVLLH